MKVLKDQSGRPLIKVPKRSKYGAKRVSVDGIKFASKAEARYYQELLLLKKAGEVIDIVLQPSYELQPSYRRHGKRVEPIRYIADFLVTYSDGRQEIIDVKGHRTPVYQLKKKMFEYQYPELQIVEVMA